MESKEIKSFYLFNSDFHRTFEFIIDFKKTDNLFRDVRSNTEITKGFNTYSPGNTFFYKVNSMPIYFEVLSYHSEDNIKTIKWKVLSELYEYIYEYTLYRCTVGEEVVLEWKLQFIDNKNIDRETIIKDQDSCINRIRDFLKTETTDFTISNSIIIRADRKDVTKYILNLSLLKNSNNYFGKVLYNGDSSTIGTNINFNFQFFAIELKFTVEKVDFNEKSKKWVYSLKSINNNNGPYNSIKNITFTMYKIHSKKLLLEIEHQVLININGEKIRSIEDQQNFLLNEIKTNFDNISTNISINKDEDNDKESESEN